MTTFKKKDIKKVQFKDKKKELDELVDADGSPIEGDRNPTNDSEIETAPQQTTDDFASMAIQPRRDLYGLGGIPYSHGVRESLAKYQMTKLIENMFEGDGDLNGNNIPDIQELSTNKQKPIAANKTQEMVNTIAKNNLDGEEIAIVLNYIIDNIKVDLIPQEYRNIIKSKL